MDSVALSNVLKTFFPPVLVDQIVETYSEVKRNFYLGHLRPNEVEGGRFAEAVFRALEFKTTGTFTPLGQPLDTERIIRSLSQLPAASHPDAVRLHIPRTLRVIYDIRNKRDAAHLGDGIDPNLQDSTLVCSCSDWVMAELIRLYHGVSANEAHALIDNLVSRKAPVVQKFGDVLKTLRPKLSLPERLLVLLYERGTQGATGGELQNWLSPSFRKNFRSTIWKLVHEKDFAFERNDHFQITRTGQLEVEKRNLLSLT